MKKNNLTDEIKSVSDWNKIVFGSGENPYTKKIQKTATANIAATLARKSLERLIK